ncbi:MAG: hypothetical protein JWM27_3859, partial [Gemmatimonadetes bacterium]|nr:hypothetical protein [Gemmatimonadota bacterium]
RVSRRRPGPSRRSPRLRAHGLARARRCRSPLPRRRRRRSTPAARRCHRRTRCTSRRAGTDSPSSVGGEPPHRRVPRLQVDRWSKGRFQLTEAALSVCALVIGPRPGIRSTICLPHRTGYAARVEARTRAERGHAGGRICCRGPGFPTRGRHPRQLRRLATYRSPSPEWESASRLPPRDSRIPNPSRSPAPVIPLWNRNQSSIGLSAPTCRAIPGSPGWSGCGPPTFRPAAGSRGRTLPP